jgi:hypothetical protein
MDQYQKDDLASSVKDLSFQATRWLKTSWGTATS